MLLFALDLVVFFFFLIFLMHERGVLTSESEQAFLIRCLSFSTLANIFFGPMNSPSGPYSITSNSADVDEERRIMRLCCARIASRSDTRDHSYMLYASRGVVLLSGLLMLSGLLSACMQSRGPLPPLLSSKSRAK